MKVSSAIFLLLIITGCTAVLFCYSCNQPFSKKKYTRASPEDSLTFFKIVDEGQLLYQQKNDLPSLKKAMVYFDSAQRFAEEIGNDELLAYSHFFKATVYDAWNKDPLKTVQYYKLFNQTLVEANADSDLVWYSKYLLSHSYQKMLDTANTIAELKDICTLTKEKASGKDYFMQLSPQLANIASNIGDYKTAKYFVEMCANKKISNVNSNNGLYTYILTRARIDVFEDKKFSSIYLDSLKWVLQDCNNKQDSQHFAHEMYMIFQAMADSAEAAKYFQIEQYLSNQLNNSKDVASVTAALTQSELEKEERTKKHYEREIFLKTVMFSGAGIMLLLVGILVFRLYLRNKTIASQAKQLNIANRNLEQKVTEIAVINKEMQHRIKNNLQTVFGLILMQEKSDVSDETKASLQLARLRIENIAALHEHLMQEGKNDTASIKDYALNVVNKAIECATHQHQVLTHCNIEDVSMPIEKKFGFGLILNEWVTNSMKYAKPLVNQLILYIDIYQHDKQVVVQYRDNGAPQATQPKAKGSGVGSSIMSLLSKQLRASITTQKDNQYHYTLTIPNDR